MESKYDPQFIKRWAVLYVDRYLKNRDEAVQWGLKFFPEDLIPLVVEQSLKEMKKRGIRPR